MINGNKILKKLGKRGFTEWYKRVTERRSLRIDLSMADLSGADLSGADLTSANLTGADLTNADLSGVNLTKVNLYNADLTNTNLIHMVLGRYNVYVQKTHTRIGCRRHANSAWLSWTPEDVAGMAPDAIDFWTAYKPVIVAAIQSLQGED